MLPPRQLAHHIIHHSPVLTEHIVTREWLQDTAPTPQTIESATAYWNFTRLNLLHAQTLGVARSQVNLVKELDPDMINREPSSMLETEDAVHISEKI
jgi:nuclear pore complex protein Nup107